MGKTLLSHGVNLLRFHCDTELEILQDLAPYGRRLKTWISILCSDKSLQFLCEIRRLWPLQNWDAPIVLCYFSYYFILLHCYYFIFMLRWLFLGFYFFPQNLKQNKTTAPIWSSSPLLELSVSTTPCSWSCNSFVLFLLVPLLLSFKRDAERPHQATYTHTHDRIAEPYNQVCCFQ